MALSQKEADELKYCVRSWYNPDNSPTKHWLEDVIDRETVKPPDDDKLCECGDKLSKHYWFNSEFVECQGKGHYSESIINGVRHQHQLMAICQCNRFREKKMDGG